MLTRRKREAGGGDRTVAGVSAAVGRATLSLNPATTSGVDCAARAPADRIRPMRFTNASSLLRAVLGVCLLLGAAAMLVGGGPADARA